jgi:hypothetical protein
LYREFLFQGFNVLSARVVVCRGAVYQGLTVFGPKKVEVTGGWRKLHNEELHGLYSLSDDQIRENEMGGAFNVHGEMRVYRILVGKPEGKRELRRQI